MTPQLENTSVIGCHTNGNYLKDLESRYTCISEISEDWLVGF